MCDDDQRSGPTERADGLHHLSLGIHVERARHFVKHQHVWIVVQRARDAEALTQAAALVLADQRADGSWPISATSNVGTPSGYGTPLATAVAREVLARAGGPAARASIERADAWFRAQIPQAVLEASAALLGLGTADDAPAVASRQAALAIVIQGQASDGGWGPYTNAPSEAFDTAVAVLALDGLRPRPALTAPAMTVQAWRRGAVQAQPDWLAEEVPVALVFNGISHAVMMASPADLEDFALGFALTEGQIGRAHV